MVPHLIGIFFKLSTGGLKTVFKCDVDILMGVVGTVALHHDFLARHMDAEMHGKAISVFMRRLWTFDNDMTTGHAIKGVFEFLHLVMNTLIKRI